MYLAEFRGPGNHHRFDDSPYDDDMDMDQRTRMLGSRPGRVILLGDGTEVLTDHANGDEDVDMDERGEASEEEDKDLAEQVKKGQSEGAASNTNGAREETPGPEMKKDGDESKKEGGSTSEPKTVPASDSLDMKMAQEAMQ